MGRIFEAFFNPTLRMTIEWQWRMLPEQAGYKKLTTTLTNIRATVRAVVVARVI